MELPDIKVLPVSAAADPRLRAVLVGYCTHATAGARCRCGLRFYLDGSVGAARLGCKLAVVFDRKAHAKKRTGEAARFNRKGAAAWRLVRLPSMLGALLEDSRSIPPRSVRRNARLSTNGPSHKSQPCVSENFVKIFSSLRGFEVVLGSEPIKWKFA
jgi:hypothetical protein